MPHKRGVIPKQLESYVFKKGNQAAKGKRGKKSLKVWVREKLEKMDEKERIEFLRRIDPFDIWRMGEGNPTEAVKHSGEIKSIDDEQIKRIAGRIARGKRSDGDTSGEEAPD